ncbi:hypothetical protein A2U01_0056841, partial [Trifolium medium]|nr:hypothetical protein [Trifolium medium]
LAKRRARIAWCGVKNTSHHPLSRLHQSLVMASCEQRSGGAVTAQGSGPERGDAIWICRVTVRGTIWIYKVAARCTRMIYVGCRREQEDTRSPCEGCWILQNGRIIRVGF